MAKTKQPSKWTEVAKELKVLSALIEALKPYPQAERERLMDSAFTFLRNWPEGDVKAT